jgi:hypothetical protein
MALSMSRGGPLRGRRPSTACSRSGGRRAGQADEGLDPTGVRSCCADSPRGSRSNAPAWGRHRGLRIEIASGPGPSPKALLQSPLTEDLCGVRSVEAVECDASMGDRWHHHQETGDDEEDPGKQPAAKRRVTILTSLLGLTQELTRIRGDQAIRLAPLDRRLRAQRTENAATAAAPSMCRRRSRVRCTARTGGRCRHASS